MKLIGFVATLLVASATYAAAQVKMEGQFVASKDCAAVQSIKKNQNAGNVSVASGKTYRLLGKNNNSASHYWIEVLGAKPAQRWVPVDCGTIDSTSSAVEMQKSAPLDTPDGTVKPKPKPKGPKGGIATYVLALSWEPAFCATMGHKAECKYDTAQSYQSSHFSLHGLWPQPRRNVFCGVDRATAALDDTHKWESLPEPELTPETKAALDKVMPGTQSVLERHEWIKHGTCYAGGDAETYFNDSIRLTNDVNNSVVQDFMQANIGRTIQTSELRRKFDEAYGRGAGEKVRINCSKDGLISELTISLKGDIPAGTELSKLINAAEPLEQGCYSGLVAAVH